MGNKFTEAWIDGHDREVHKKCFAEYSNPNGDTCTYCGGAHWRPNCPEIRVALQKQYQGGDDSVGYNRT